MESNQENFELLFNQLNEIVRVLESGQLSLEDSLKAFQQGVDLSQKCQVFLSQSKLKIEELTQSLQNSSSGKSGIPLNT